MDLCAIVVIACHFAGRDQLCATTIARLERALREIESGRPWQYFFVVTGDVPYEPGSSTLAELMQEYLRSHGFKGDIITAIGETGSFAEPRLVCAMLRGIQRRRPKIDQLIVVSSDWQLLTGEPFWRRYAAESYLQLCITPVWNTGGWRTRLFYAIYAKFIHALLAAGLWRPPVERFLYRMLYAGRRHGFKANGCA